MSIFGKKIKTNNTNETGGGLNPGGGGGGVIIRCIFWFTGRWAYNQGAYKQQFIVSVNLIFLVKSGMLNLVERCCY